MYIFFPPQPGRYVCTAFEFFDVGPTNLQPDVATRQYTNVNSLTRNPLATNTPLQPWVLPPVSGSGGGAPPAPAPPTVSLGVCRSSVGFQSSTRALT